MSVASLAAMTAPVLAADAPITVESLLKDGWEVAGYAASFDRRSLILFKHKERGYLVECSVLYDVTRVQRVNINCYEVR